MDLGLERAGHHVVGMCEIDPKARSVLARHWPDAPLHDDVSTFDGKAWRGRVDVVSGGSPCQDLSVAGRRGGLDGERSGLFWQQCRIAAECAAPWVLWENVPGALSSNHGADFAAVLWGFTGALADVPAGGWRGMGVVVGPERFAVWRVLDARWFGVAQRRRRVFVVSGPRARLDGGLQVLLEPASCERDSRPSAATGPPAARDVGSGTDLDSRHEYVGSLTAMDGWERPDNAHAEAGWLVPTVSSPVTAKWAKGTGGPAGDECQNLVPFVKTVRSGARDADGNLPPEVWAERQVAPTLNAMDNGGESRATVLAVSENQRGELRLTDYARQITAGGGKPGQGYPAVMFEDDRRTGVRVSADIAPTPQSFMGTGGNNTPMLHEASLAVRRLTPLECERLMGWPDDHTRWAADGSEIADSARYRMCGNGVVAPVTEWIGRRFPARMLTCPVV